MSLSRLLAAAIAVGMLGTTAIADISNSKHDFSTEGWNNTGEVCVVCHTPHNADTTVGDAPLWSHDVTTATFTLYSSSTLNTTLGQPDGVSKLCLSCHDGTVALDSFGGRTGSSFISGGELIGTDLSDDHPISFAYDTSLATADGGLFDPTTATTALGGTIQQDLLVNSRMECSSCHDIHDQYNNPDLLKIDNTGSTLCLTCHDK